MGVLKSQIPNFLLNITKLLSIRNNYQHFMAFYMIPYNHDDKLNIYVCLKIILTSYCTVLDFFHECLFCFYFDDALAESK